MFIELMLIIAATMFLGLGLALEIKKLKKNIKELKGDIARLIKKIYKIKD